MDGAPGSPNELNFLSTTCEAAARVDWGIWRTPATIDMREADRVPPFSWVVLRFCRGFSRLRRGRKGSRGFRGNRGSGSGGFGFGGGGRVSGNGTRFVW